MRLESEHLRRFEVVLVIELTEVNDELNAVEEEVTLIEVAQEGPDDLERQRRLLIVAPTPYRCRRMDVSRRHPAR
jgi:hypothetical protein